MYFSRNEIFINLNPKVLKIFYVKIAFICLLFTSCEHESSKPQNLIEKDKMADVLADMLVLEAKVSRVSINNIDSTRTIYKYLENQIYKKYSIDSATYRSSYQYYIERPQVLKEIYDNSIKNIEKLRDKSKKNG